MATPVVVAGASPANEGAVLLMQRTASPIAVRAAEPWALALPAPEGPLLLELYDLCLAVEDDGDLEPATGPQHRVIFQELAVGPFPRLGVTSSEGCDHSCERNRCSAAYLSWLRSLTALALC